MAISKLDVFKQMCIHCGYQIDPTFGPVGSDTTAAVEGSILPTGTNYTQAAEVFNLLYENNRQQLLTMANWKFAMKRVKLQKISNPVDKYPWMYVWAQPIDYLEGGNYTLYYGTRIGNDNRGNGFRLTLIDDSQGLESYGQFKYEKRGDRYFTIVEHVDFDYVWDVPVSQMSSVAQDLLALKIAHQACGLLGVTGSRRDRLDAEIDKKMFLAQKQFRAPKKMNLHSGSRLGNRRPDMYGEVLL